MKLFLNSIFIFLGAISSVAQVTKTNNTSGRVENSTITRTVSYVSGVDFPVGSIITDVNVSINFTRLEDGNAILCSHNGSSPWNGDLAYTLTSPTGTSINLLQGFPSQTYTDQNTYGGNVTINFDQGAATAANSSTFPIAGTFRPHAGNLNSFNGLTPFGTWTISTNDPFAGFGETCHNSFSITITCSVPCTNPSLPTIIPATICNGQSATLNVSSGALNDATNWVWYTGGCGGTLVGTGSSITVSPTSTTTYFVRGEGGCVSPGSCSSVTVTVNPLPAISISGTNTICNGSSTTLTASGGNTYLWNTSSTSNPITVSPSGTTTYSVTGTDGNGCSNSASRTVTVNSLPAISISGTNTICNGSSTTLTASGGNTYLWNTSSTSNPITVSPSGTTTYSVTGTDGNGCSNSASRTVTVNQIPTILFANNDSRCGTGVVNLSVIGASGSYTYGWYASATGGTSLNSTDSYSPTLSNTTTYYVEATENGCTSSPRMVVTGTVNPLPAISISGTNTICNGSSTTLTASGGNTYLWNTSSTSNPITVSPSGTTTYSVTGTDGNGCSNSASRTVTVNSLPAISISGTNTICNGSSTTLTASGGNTYLWNTSSTSNPITVSPSGTTTYSVTGTDGNGCSNSASRTVTVNSLPAISISGTNTICNGSSTTLTASGGNTYLWNTSSTSNPITVSPSGTTTYSVTGTDGNGCSNSASRTVTVNPIPTILFANNDSRCGTGVVNLSVIGASGSYTYGWYASATGGTSLNSTDSYSPTLSNTTTYYVEATENGCTSSPRMVVTGTVNPLPAISISGTNTICNGSSTTLTASGGNTYLWNTSSTSNPITVSPTGTTTYSVTGTDGNGCSGNANFLVTVINPNSGSQSITSCDSYTWSANGTTYTASGIYTAMLTNISGCDSTATLNLTITNSNSGSQSITSCDSYTWSANGTTYTSSGIYTAMLSNISGCDSTALLNLIITNSNSGSQSITSCDSYTWSANGTTYTSSGTYTAMLTNDSGCDSTATLNLTIHSSPDITTTLNGFTITSNQNGAIYQWIDCNNSNTAIVNEINQSFNVVTNGNYAVIVNNNGCLDTSACVNINTIHVEETFNNSIISVYPNPSIGKISIQTRNGNSVQLLFYNLVGELVLSKENTTSTEVDLPSGTYFLWVKMNLEVLKY